MLVIDTPPQRAKGEFVPAAKKLETAARKLYALPVQETLLSRARLLLLRLATAGALIDYCRHERCNCLRVQS